MSPDRSRRSPRHVRCRNRFGDRAHRALDAALGGGSRAGRRWVTRRSRSARATLGLHHVPRCRQRARGATTGRNARRAPAGAHGVRAMLAREPGDAPRGGRLSPHDLSRKELRMKLRNLILIAHRDLHRLQAGRQDARGRPERRQGARTSARDSARAAPRARSPRRPSASPTRPRRRASTSSSAPRIAPRPHGRVRERRRRLELVRDGLLGRGRVRRCAGPSVGWTDWAWYRAPFILVRSMGWPAMMDTVIATHTVLVSEGTRP